MDLHNIQIWNYTVFDGSKKRILFPNNLYIDCHKTQCNQGSFHEQLCESRMTVLIMAMKCYCITLSYNLSLSLAPIKTPCIKKYVPLLEHAVE